MSEESSFQILWEDFKSFVVDNTIAKIDQTKHSLYSPEYSRLKAKYPDVTEGLISKQAADNVGTILTQQKFAKETVFPNGLPSSGGAVMQWASDKYVEIINNEFGLVDKISLNHFLKQDPNYKPDSNYEIKHGESNSEYLSRVLKEASSEIRFDDNGNELSISKPNKTDNLLNVKQSGEELLISIDKSFNSEQQKDLVQSLPSEAKEGSQITINGTEYTKSSKSSGDILKSINPEAKPEDIETLNAGSIEVSANEGEVSYFVEKNIEVDGGDGRSYGVISLLDSIDNGLAKIGGFFHKQFFILFFNGAICGLFYYYMDNKFSLTHNK